MDSDDGDGPSAEEEPKSARSKNRALVRRLLAALRTLRLPPKFRDALQTTLLKVLAREDYTPIADPVAFLWAAVKHAWISDFRHEQAERENLRAAGRVHARKDMSPLDALIAYDAAFAVATVIAELQPSERWLILRRDWLEGTIAELALATVGVDTPRTRKNVSTTLTIIRKKIMATMVWRHGADAAQMAKQADPDRLAAYFTLIAHADGLV